jgi:colanic acid biosynthesis protein WcaH
MYLSQTDFSSLIKVSPLISIDLCILRDREILLGRRKNSPAKNYFFVPGGRIFKSELKKNALIRLLKNELGYSVKTDFDKFIKFLGVYEHFYSDNFLDNSEFNTHYVVLAYLIPYEYLIQVNKEVDKSQHSEYIWYQLDAPNSNEYLIHKYAMEYFKHPILKIK